MEVQDLKKNEIHLLTELQPKGWPDIVPMFDFYTKAAFCFPIKISIDHKIVGVGVSIVHHNIAWLAHVITHPAYRKQGIGQLIIQTLSNRLKTCDTIYLIATELGAPVYQKAGFETDTEYIFFENVKLLDNSTVSHNINPFTQDATDQITRLDRQVSGEDRMFHVQAHLPQGYVYKQTDTVEGFYLPTLGEGSIIANTTTAGIALMQLHLTQKNKVVFPTNNVAATEFMLRQNHTKFTKAKRMRLGKEQVVMFNHIYNRIGGNFG